MSKNSKIKAICVSGAIFLLAVDQLFKYLYFDLAARNYAQLFGLTVIDANLQLLLMVLLLSGLTVYLIVRGKDLSVFWFGILIFIFAAGLSNTIDRISLGYILDYIHMLGISFNLADVTINLMLSLVIVKLITKEWNEYAKSSR